MGINVSSSFLNSALTSTLSGFSGGSAQASLASVLGSAGPTLSGMVNPGNVNSIQALENLVSGSVAQGGSTASLMQQLQTAYTAATSPTAASSSTAATVVAPTSAAQAALTGWQNMFASNSYYQNIHNEIKQDTADDLSKSEDEAHGAVGADPPSTGESTDETADA